MLDCSAALSADYRSGLRSRGRSRPATTSPTMASKPNNGKDQRRCEPSGLVGELHRAGARWDVDTEEEAVGVDDVGGLVRRHARSIPARSGGARSPAWVTGRSPSPRARSATADRGSSPISEPSASRPTASPIQAGFSHTSKPPPTSSVRRQPGSCVATSRVGSMRTQRTPSAAASAGCHDSGRSLRSGSVGSTSDAWLRSSATNRSVTWTPPS